MSEDLGTFGQRMEARRLETEAKRLDNEAARLRRGFLHGTLLPALTWTACIVICAASVRHYCITGTIFDTSSAPLDHDVFFGAQRDYNNGNLDASEQQATKILQKVPSHAPANLLMAQIALARGDRKGGIGYLRRSLDGAHNREQVARWIATLEGLP